MHKVLLRPTAEADLAQLYHTIAEQTGSHEREIGYIRRIRVWCEKLLTRNNRPGNWLGSHLHAHDPVHRHHVMVQMVRDPQRAADQRAPENTSR